MSVFSATGIFSNLVKNVWRSVTATGSTHDSENNDKNDKNESKSDMKAEQVFGTISEDFEEDEAFSNLKLVLLEDNFERLSDMLNEAEITLEHILKTRKESWSDSLCAQDNFSLSSRSTTPSLEDCSDQVSMEDLDLSDCDSEEEYAEK